MAAKSEVAGKGASSELVMTRIIDAPRELVWRAWTEPKMMAEWWGPQQFTNRVERLDVPKACRRKQSHNPGGIRGSRAIRW